MLQEQTIRESLLQNSQFQSCLWDSDIRYFQAAAQNRDMLGGQLSYMSGLSSQAGACVFHSLESLPGHEPDWLKKLEAVFLEKRVQRSRLYLQENKNEDALFLKQHGYRPIIEVGMACKINETKTPAKTEKSLKLAAVNEQLWPLHEDLLSCSEAAPDGHRMQANDYALLEKRKVEAGYMQLFLYLDNNKALAVASLDINRPFARIKNLLVHPDQRGQGLGKSMIASLIVIAQAQGAQAIGAYALADNKAACGMYQALGLKKVYQQYEWLKMMQAHE